MSRFLRRSSQSRPRYRTLINDLPVSFSGPRPRDSFHTRHSHTSMAASSPIAPDKPLEEETLPDYEPEQFYPVHIGERLGSRYDVIGKLGFGANSTVWFCRDIKYSRHLSLKSGFMVILMFKGLTSSWPSKFT